MGLEVFGMLAGLADPWGMGFIIGWFLSNEIREMQQKNLRKFQLWDLTKVYQYGTESVGF